MILLLFSLIVCALLGGVQTQLLTAVGVSENVMTGHRLTTQARAVPYGGDVVLVLFGGVLNSSPDQDGLVQVIVPKALSQEGKVNEYKLTGTMGGPVASDQQGSCQCGPSCVLLFGTSVEDAPVCFLLFPLFCIHALVTCFCFLVLVVVFFLLLLILTILFYFILFCFILFPLRSSVLSCMFFFFSSLLRISCQIQIYSTIFTFVLMSHLFWLGLQHLKTLGGLALTLLRTTMTLFGSMVTMNPNVLCLGR